MIQYMPAQAPSFSEQDFNVFMIPGLEARMEALIANVRPKLTLLGDMLAPALSLALGEEMFPHVAKHARRTVYPPNDTWVAIAANKRGYKMLPHFQVGLFQTHLFAQFAIIYESENKKVFAEALNTRLEEIRSVVPPEFVWSMDHTKPEVTPHETMTDEDFKFMAKKLSNTKSAEVMVGIQIRHGDPLLSKGDSLYETFVRTFETLIPLYKMSFPC